MRLQRLPLLLALAVLLVCVAAWSKEDHEIFRLRNDIITLHGPNATFYNFLGVKNNANQKELIKAYHRKSKQLHPDKVKRAFVANYGKKKTRGRKPGLHVSRGPTDREVDRVLKEATEDFSRLGIIVDILKGPGRERYDYFLRNGFPKWKGTGYYYSRFRPGLGSVLVGLFLGFGGAAHYIALTLSWKRQVEFVERYISHARKAAWGDDVGGIKGMKIGRSATDGNSSAPNDEDGAVAVNRRQKRMLDKENKKENKKSNKSQQRGGEPSGGDRRRVIAENGKVLIVDAAGSVFLEEENEDGEKEEFLLDINEFARPTIKDTMLVRLPVWIARKVVSSVSRTSSTPEEPDLFDTSDESGADFGNSSSAEEVLVARPRPSSTKNRSKKKNKRG